MNKQLERLLKDADSFTQKGLKKFHDHVIEHYEKALSDIDKEIQKLYLKFNGQPKIIDVQKFNRLKNLQLKINLILNDAEKKSRKTIINAITQSVDDGYYSQSYAYFNSFQAAGVQIGFKLLDPNVVKISEKATREEITGYIFKNKVNGKWIWDNSLKDNHAKAFRRINDTIKQGIIQGKGYEKTAREVKKQLFSNQKRQFNVTKAIQRIVATETGKARSLASLMSYNDLKVHADRVGVKVQRLWLATLDNRVRDTHLSLHNQPENENGQWIVNGEPMDGPKLGTLPENVINCRCDTTTQTEGLESTFDESKLAYRKLNEDKLKIWKTTLK